MWAYTNVVHYEENKAEIPLPLTCVIPFQGPLANFVCFFLEKGFKIRKTSGPHNIWIHQCDPMRVGVQLPPSLLHH